MPPPRRKLQATIEETVTPPHQLEDGQVIARVIKGNGKNLYNVELPDSSIMLVELEAKFRSTIWLKRGGYVIVDVNSLADRENKIDGEIINVVRDEKRWSKTSYWPKEFIKKPATVDSSDEEEEESNVGKLPPSSDDEA